MDLNSKSAGIKIREPESRGVSGSFPWLFILSLIFLVAQMIFLILELLGISVFIK